MTDLKIFRGKKLSRMRHFETFRGKKLSRKGPKNAKPRKFLPAKVSDLKVGQLPSFISNESVSDFGRSGLENISLVGAHLVGGRWSVVL